MKTKQRERCVTSSSRSFFVLSRASARALSSAVLRERERCLSSLFLTRSSFIRFVSFFFGETLNSVYSWYPFKSLSGTQEDVSSCCFLLVRWCIFCSTLSLSLVWVSVPKCAYFSSKQLHINRKNERKNEGESG